MNFPKHLSLTIDHNDYQLYYQSAQWWADENQRCDWENDEAKARAIATGEIWTMQWYPNTPVGFEAIAAPTLEELLAFAQKVAAQHERVV